MAALTGKALLDAQKTHSAAGLSKTAQARACGYTRVDKEEKEFADVQRFSAALLEATGLSFPTNGHRVHGPRGLLHVGVGTKVVVGKAYLSLAGANVGDAYEVRVADDDSGIIELVPAEAAA